MTALFERILLMLLVLLPASVLADNEVKRGEYLTTILGCGGCHTEGALLGRQTGAWLAGSQIGVAYSNPESGDHPAVVFPANLTNEARTGLGQSSEQEIARAIRTGVGHSHESLVPVMPWQNYSLLSTHDARAIAAYLKSLDGVEHPIPKRVELGTPSSAPYLRVSIFFFDPVSRTGVAPQEGENP